MANLFSRAHRVSAYRRHAVPVWLSLSFTASLGLAWAPIAQATVTLLQPPRELAGERPLTLTLLLAQDAPGSQRYAIPESIDVRVITTDGTTPRQITLHRAGSQPAAVTLRSGQYRKVVYDTPWPKDLRGTLRLEPVGFDAAQSVVALNWGKDATANATIAAAPLAPLATPSNATSGAGTNTAAGASDAASESGTAAAGTSAGSNLAVGTGTAIGAAPGTQASPSSPADASASLASAPAPLAVETDRLTFNEPIYFGVGASGDTTAKFQLSFKYRLFEPKDPRSRSFFDNLYFGYTQLSLWDLSEESKPFKDTNFRPSFFYYLPDTGIRANWYSQFGIQTGLEHESNGLGGSDSRSLNIFFVRPTLTWNNVFGNRLVVSPKIYYYLEKDENPDIAKYRGYTDLLVKYGNPDGLELATTFRKGTSDARGSIEAQLTYPMQKLFGAGFGGYLWLGGFTGYGETLIDYNQHSNALRIGYSISR